MGKSSDWRYNWYSIGAGIVWATWNWGRLPNKLLGVVRGGGDLGKFFLLNPLVVYGREVCKS